MCPFHEFYTYEDTLQQTAYSTRCGAHHQVCFGANGDSCDAGAKSEMVAIQVDSEKKSSHPGCGRCIALYFGDAQQHRARSVLFFFVSFFRYHVPVSNEVQSLVLSRIEYATLQLFICRENLPVFGVFSLKARSSLSVTYTLTD